MSDPISTDNGTAIVKVLDKQETSADEISRGKDGFREELLNDRRNRFFASYMQMARKRMDIKVNREQLQKAVS